MSAVRIRRLIPGDRALARALFVMMAEVFEEARAPLGDGYLDRLLARDDFWAIAAVTVGVVDASDMADDVGGAVVGGLTAHTLPMTRAEASEVFLYDIAVRGDWQRRGIGGQLVRALRDSAAAAGCHEVFVAADNDDGHALDFYRALGGAEAPVTMFMFSREPTKPGG